jgi:hypothetical protein
MNYTALMNVFIGLTVGCTLLVALAGMALAICISEKAGKPAVRAARNALVALFGLDLLFVIGMIISAGGS